MHTTERSSFNINSRLILWPPFLDSSLIGGYITKLLIAMIFPDHPIDGSHSLGNRDGEAWERRQRSLPADRRNRMCKKSMLVSHHFFRYLRFVHFAHTHDVEFCQSPIFLWCVTHQAWQLTTVFKQDVGHNKTLPHYITTLYSTPTMLIERCLPSAAQFEIHNNRWAWIKRMYLSFLKENQTCQQPNCF